MPELVRDHGLVLRTQDHAETDRLVSLLAEGRGRVELLVKGARRLERPFGAVLDVLNLAEVIYYRRRSGLHLLREATLLQDFPGVRADLARLEAALLLLRWAWELVPREVPDPRPFRLTLGFLHALGESPAPPVLLAAYRLRLLSLLGYRPALQGCVACGRRESLVWVPERGGLVCRACGGEGPEVPSRIQRALDGLLRLPLAALLRLRLPPEDLQEIERLTRAFREVQLAR
ncbi:DNA repair protein RecO [Thermus sp.]|uniref:DNA repair protein RecO n=1 Tax=Thermus sp. TaxID=275 RepID=UPI002633F6E8|nr:DNA repair protein RecO [Thermus sp.]MCS7216286.1 DNA repair protein RecO [Candidatus Bipolaricaulota bacterium]MCX7850261.1 DNA repair protein RecO [Thermus sp.]MDW8151516.1 DNA repair protein RecO [Candidatus Bipolaricaulota bacterium]